ncbi:MAG: septum formation initiator family protein [Phycisphaerae bacterium]
MEQVTGRDHARRRVAWGQHVLFTIFVTTSFAVFGAALLLPLLRDYARVRNEERAMLAEVDRLDQQRADLMDLASAIRDDPATMERLARQELGYTRPKEQIVRVKATAPTAPADAAPRSAMPPAKAESIVPRDWPGWAHHAEQWAVGRGWTNAFLDSRRRSAWLLLSGGLLVSAFVVFAPRRRAQAE